MATNAKLNKDFAWFPYY